MHIENHGALIRLKYLNNEKSELKKQKKEMFYSYSCNEVSLIPWNSPLFYWAIKELLMLQWFDIDKDREQVSTFLPKKFIPDHH